MKNLVSGMHIAVSCGLYTHHGIYVGSGRVVHYSGFARAFNKGAIEETSIVDFLDGKDEFTIINYPQYQAAYSPSKVAARAIGRIGEDNYNLVFNNCEHFACWCVTGCARSEQVETVMTNTSTAISSYRLIQSALNSQIPAKTVSILASTATPTIQRALVNGLIGGGAVATTSLVGAGAVSTGLVGAGTVTAGLVGAGATAGLFAAAPVVVPAIVIGTVIGGLFSLFD